jgi:rubrerythrin
METEQAIVIRDTPVIARRLGSCIATVSNLTKEYHLAHGTVMAFMISAAKHEQIRHSLPYRARFSPGHPPWNRGSKASVDKDNYLNTNDRSVPQHIRDSLEALRQTVSWWECLGCAHEFTGEPPFSCPKCGGLRFAIISQKNKVI